MNWSKDRSIALSRGCVVLFMILLAALDIGCYWAVRWFIGLRFMPWQSGVLMMVTIYLCSGFGWVLLVRLWQLLDNIRPAARLRPAECKAPAAGQLVLRRGGSCVPRQLPVLSAVHRGRYRGGLHGAARAHRQEYFPAGHRHEGRA